MMPKQGKHIPINAAARNAMWVYPHVVPPRFAGAPHVVETRRSHEVPDFASLPEGSDVAVEIYGGAVTLRLRGDLPRVYVERFTYVSFDAEEHARAAFLLLWREVESMESASDVERAAKQWYERESASR